MWWLLATCLAWADPVDEAHALLEQGVGHCREDRYTSGIAALERSLAVLPEDEPGLRALTLASLSSCEQQAGKLADALRHAEAAEEIYATRRPDGTFRFENLLHLCNLSGQLNAGESVSSRGLVLLELLDQADDVQQWTRAVRHASWALHAQDRTAEAVTWMQRVVSHPELEQVELRFQAAAWADLAGMYIATDEYELALEASTRALEVTDRDPEPREGMRSDLHHNRARLHEAMGNVEQAFNDGLTALRLVQGTDLEWGPLLLLSDLCLRLDRLEAAARWVERAEQSALAVRDDATYEVVQRNIELQRMMVEYRKGNSARAYELAQRAADSPLSDAERIQVLSMVAICALEAGELPAARRATDELIALVAPRLDQANIGAHLVFRRRLQVSRDIYLEPWLEAHDRPEDHLRALDQVLAWRAAGQRTAVRLQRALRRAGVDTTELVRRQRAFSDGVWRVHPPRSPRAERLRLDRDAEEQRLMQELSIPPPSEVPAASELCAALPEDGALLVYRHLRSFGTGEHRLLTFVMRAGDCEQVHRLERVLPKDTDLDALTAAFADRLWRPASAELVGPSGRALREILLEHVEPVLAGAEHLFIVPAFGMATLPWAALPDGEGYLVERYTLTVVDHVLPPESAPAGQGTLLVKRPDYGPHIAGPEGTLADCAELDLPDLPGAAAEIDRIAAVSGRRHAPVTVLEGAQASEAALEAALMQRPARLHLATHGFFLSLDCYPRRGALVDAPLVLTGLALAGAGGEGSEGDDGIWTGAEVSALDLSGTELVVLSACEAGWAESFRGGDAQGLRAAFARAGVRHQVLAMAPVPDQETAALMAYFYRALRKLPPAEALRAAQRALIAEQRRTTGTTRPHTWGSWVLVGR